MGAAVETKIRQPGRRRRSRRGQSHAMSEINVTPFVDVMLVLLIIFMVAAPLMTVGVPVELPETAATSLPASDEEPLTVSVTADGRLAIQTTEIAPEDLIPQLRAVIAERTDRRIYLRADGGLPYEAVVQVMGALNNAGFTDIGLVTETGGPTLDGQNAGDGG